MTQQPRQQIVTIHKLLNISRSKGSQTMKFGQSIEHNMKNNCFEQSHIKYVRETNPRPFFKKSKLNIFLDRQCQLSHYVTSL